MFNKKKAKIGIAFGGGGARGFAHLGVLKAFEENGIEFDEVAGTSVGSLIGAFYAFGIKYDELYKLSKEIKAKDIRNSKLFFVPSKTDGIENLVKSVIGDTHFEDAKKPLTIVAVDLISGKEIHITKGNIAKAVAGSCAVPGFFNPVDFEGFRLADGGLQNNIPADVVRNRGCKFVVSVDINPTRGNGTTSTKLLDILSASIRIMMKSNAVKGKVFSDVLIEANTDKFSSTKLDGAEDMIQIGYESAMKAMPQIKKMLGMEKSPSFWHIFKRNKKKILEEQELNSLEK